MEHTDHLLYMMETNQWLMKTLLDDITEEESLVRGGEKLNHIRWLTGHLVYSDAYSLELLGDTSVNYRDYQGQFAAGEEVSSDGSAYPSMADLRAKLYEVNEKQIAAAKSAGAEVFEKIVGEGENKKPAWKYVTFLCMHEMYHAGQIVQIRRLLGRDRPVG